MVGIASVEIGGIPRWRRRLKRKRRKGAGRVVPSENSTPSGDMDLIAPQHHPDPAVLGGQAGGRDERLRLFKGTIRARPPAQDAAGGGAAPQGAIPTFHDRSHFGLRAGQKSACDPTSVAEVKGERPPARRDPERIGRARTFRQGRAAARSEGGALLTIGRDQHECIPGRRDQTRPVRMDEGEFGLRSGQRFEMGGGIALGRDQAVDAFRGGDVERVVQARDGADRAGGQTVQRIEQAETRPEIDVRDAVVERQPEPSFRIELSIAGEGVVEPGFSIQDLDQLSVLGEESDSCEFGHDGDPSAGQNLDPGNSLGAKPLLPLGSPGGELTRTGGDNARAAPGEQELVRP